MQSGNNTLQESLRIIFTRETQWQRRISCRPVSVTKFQRKVPLHSIMGGGTVL